MELDRSSLSRQVYEDIVTRIRNRTIHQGQKITLRHIQETYDVSSSPARDAISLLVRYGFVEIQPGGGSAVVVVMDEKKTRDTLELFACNCHSAAKLVLRHNKAQVLALVKENFGLQLQHQNAPAAMRARIYGDLINLFVDNTGNSLFANTVDPNLGRMVIAFGD